MKNILWLFLVVPFLWSCAADQAAAPDDYHAPQDPTKTVRIDTQIPYEDGARIDDAIKQECVIDRQLSEFIQSYGAENGVAVDRSGRAEPDAEGNVLVVEITDAVSRGNAFIGHRKYTDVAGTLYEDGEKQASFTGTRFSGGGAFAGFKGSCSVLGRTVETLGKDIAGWLQNPVDGQHLGDRI